jgi:hypothetical protein
VEAVTLSPQNHLQIGHEASDFAFAHRDVWIAVEFLNAANAMGYPIMYSSASFNCHQMHSRVKHNSAKDNNKDMQMDQIFKRKLTYSNTRLKKHWGLSQMNNLYEQVLLRRGLGVCFFSYFLLIVIKLNTKCT